MLDELDELVLSIRKALPSTVRHELINGVEAILGRKVIAFISDNHIGSDVAVEVFVLAPAEAGPRGDEAGGVATAPSEAIAAAGL